MGLNFKTLIFLSFILKDMIVTGYFGWGPCPSIPKNAEQYVSLKDKNFHYSFEDFNAGQYLGTWYDVLRTSDFPWAKGNCTQALYYIREDGRVGVLNSEIINGKNHSIIGEVFADTNIPGQLYAKFFRFAPLGDYKVIRTDYEKSSLVFSCISLWVFHWKYAWILARNVNTEVPSYHPIIEALGIPMSAMLKTSHDNC
ncbi:hypothetical protein SteCoe_14868 [Stentor coeruleus]|uniref:Lipocalin/cytosolic fatty-acid binding domain-containing protein n=1 Tax=Stentor coeruleus TaxID=5963 RepID=A0A1R2C4Z1_9CILI|nr:hypothetical protein SteCoe_14868 [Stentor coeruleus]